MIDRERVPEQHLAALKNAVDRSNKQTAEHIREFYETPQEDKDNILFYHNQSHTQGVIRRGVSIGQVVAAVCPNKVSATDIEAIRLAAGKHDEVQLSKPVEVTLTAEDGRAWKMVKRQRATGENERLSAESLRDFVEREIIPSGLLEAQQVDDAIKGILLTTPGWDAANKTVVQPGFAESPFIAQAVALADLAGSGMEGAQTAVREAVALFWEEYMEIRRYKDEFLPSQSDRREQRIAEASVEQLYKGQIMDWLGRQVEFIQGRKNLIWGEIDSLNISEEGKQAVRNLFSNTNFEEAVNAVVELRNNLIGLSFADCAKQLDAILYDEQPDQE